MRSLSFIIFIFILHSTYGKQFSRKTRVLFNSADKKLLNAKWYQGENDHAEMMELVKILTQSKTGRILLRKAKAKASESGKTLMDVLLVGEGSLTDTTLIRRFSPRRPDRVVYEAHSKVYINRDLSIKNAVLDLAHELTHFVMRDPFNPYESHFTAEQFITSTVEGKGGEVEAFLVECQVLRELFPKSWKSHSNCEYVEDESGKLSKAKGIEYFYKVGPFEKQFQSNLRQQGISTDSFEFLTGETAIFISSAHGIPYPLAALKEYEIIMEKVCLNDKKRLDLIQEKLSAQDRSPASLDVIKNYKSIIAQYNKRCYTPRQTALNP